MVWPSSSIKVVSSTSVTPPIVVATISWKVTSTSPEMTEVDMSTAIVENVAVPPIIVV